MRSNQRDVYRALVVLAAIGCAIGLGTRWSAVFHAPLLLSVGLALWMPRWAFVTASGAALSGVLFELLANHQSGIELASSLLFLVCVLAMIAGRRWMGIGTASKVDARSGEYTSFIDSSVGLVGDRSSGGDTVTSICEPTEIRHRSILERLRVSGQFSKSQLEVIETELEGYFHGVRESDGGLMEFPVGTEIGSFVIESLVGQGGSGQVYIARPKAGGETVALKLLSNAKTSSRFQREMELVQKIAHPNVVIAYGVGDHRGTPFIVMEHLSGPDLSHSIRSSGPVMWQQSVEIILQAARGLEHAHHRGLVHRDVKPANLIWDGKRRIKVADLGLAAQLAEDTETTFQTRHDIVAGTPDYMAPEQAKSLANATARSDVYSLAATWYFLLTGESRVPGEGLQEKLSNLFTGNFGELPDDLLPKPVRRIWEKMIAIDPDSRYPSMSDVIDALSGVSQTTTTPVKADVEVLVVEDDEDDLLLTVEMLRRINRSLTIQSAHTLHDAIGCCQQGCTIDVVLLDLRLPDSAGIETVEQMRAALTDVPIVVLTGQNDVELGQACIRAGADDFACKNDLNAHFMERLIFITISRFKRKQASILE